MQINRNLIEDGYISERKHPEVDYFIYNYTAKSQYGQVWNEDTLNCRGLILDKEGNIIARPFPKFFNIEEYQENSHLGKLPSYKWFDVFDKLDGSLGILYQLPNGDYKVATRGSFESEQAKVGTALWELKYDFLDLDNDYTYLFEIIYPENRIVVDYGNKKDLILLAGIHKGTGKELEYKDLWELSKKIGCPMAKYYGRTVCRGQDGLVFKKLGSGIAKGKEGFVLRYDSGLRVKIKSDEYVRLHKLITGVSNKSIWELLRNGQDVDELLERVPDEFYEWVKSTKEKFEKEYKAIDIYCKVCLSNIASLKWAEEEGIVRETAEQIKKLKYPSVIFAMWRDKEYRDIIWKLIKPKYTKPFKEEV